MRRLERDLDRAKIPHRIATFEGAHDWAPSVLLVSAIEWMEVQAIRSGIRESSEAFIDESLRSGIRDAAAAEGAGETCDAVLQYESLCRDFAGLRDVADLQRKAEQLKGSKEFQQVARREQSEEESQNRWMNTLMNLKGTCIGAEDRAKALSDMNHAITDLNDRANKKDATRDRLVARRVRGEFLTQLRQDAASATESGNYVQAALDLSLMLTVGPDSPRLYYSVGCAYALAGSRRDALASLKRAVERGFADLEALETNPDLDGLRKDPEFQRILEDLRKKQRDAAQPAAPADEGGSSDRR
jgi:hypothetical protein